MPASRLLCYMFVTRFRAICWCCLLWVSMLWYYFGYPNNDCSWQCDGCVLVTLYAALVLVIVVLFWFLCFVCISCFNVSGSGMFLLWVVVSSLDICVLFWTERRHSQHLTFSISHLFKFRHRFEPSVRVLYILSNHLITKNTHNWTIVTWATLKVSVTQIVY